MPDNVQFIYGKLIEIQRAGLLVYALISLNQQTIYFALMCSSPPTPTSPQHTYDLLDPIFNVCK